MARTKQTARKATGGSAGRVKLLIGGDGNSSAVGRQDAVEVCEGFRHNDGRFCRRRCPGLVRRMSTRRLHSLCHDSPGVRTGGPCAHVTFRCICCHIAGQRQGGNALTPYLGFYRNNKPVLDSFLPIRAALEINVTSQLSSDTLLFVHLTLVDYDTNGSSFELGHQFLLPYFPHAGMQYHKVTFDIGTTSKVKTYRNSMAALVGKLSSTAWSRVVFGISNHTDNSSGDPYVGYERKTYVATPVHDFLAIILGPWQGLINKAQSHSFGSFLVGRWSTIRHPSQICMFRLRIMAFRPP
ncbi:hypothetical protein F4604DRAFT_1936007 [Suillus subluteus]|nr:hypothetical protein F4604DRAFT_1936007 [Suillus subluteus]